MAGVDRIVTGFHLDEDEAQWVAELACGHNQHVRHAPPFQVREWTTTEQGRGEMLGKLRDCPLCDAAELPEGLAFDRVTPTWDEGSVPAALRCTHTVHERSWGLLEVTQGSVRFACATSPAIDVVLNAPATQPIPPGVEHHLELIGPVELHVAFFKIDR